MNRLRRNSNGKYRLIPAFVLAARENARYIKLIARISDRSRVVGRDGGAERLVAFSGATQRARRASDSFRQLAFSSRSALGEQRVDLLRHVLDRRGAAEDLAIDEERRRRIHAELLAAG